jgi:putative salt-induced outer membrane protein YdiY
VESAEKPVALHPAGQRVVHTPNWREGVRNLGESLQEYAFEINAPPFPEGEIDVFTENLGFWIPTLHLDRDIWDGSVEFGSNGTHGNSTTFSVFAGLDLERRTTIGRFDLDLDFAKKSASGTLTTHRTLVDIAHFWIIKDNPLSWFAKGGLEYDEFKQFDIRMKVNAGFQKIFFRGEQVKLSWRIGAGISQELGGVDDEVTPEADFGMIMSRNISSRQSVQATSDYYPDWSNFSEYRFESKASWKIVIDKEHGWSLKLSMADRYDSTPHGRRPNDLTYSLVLVWQL